MACWWPGYAAHAERDLLLLFARLRLCWTVLHQAHRADPRGAMLARAPVRRADLSLTNLCQATLCAANLAGAWLTLAEMRGTSLCGAQLEDANLQGAEDEPGGRGIRCMPARVVKWTSA